MKNMTKICIFIALCLLIVLQHSSAYSASFVEIYRDDDYLIFLDTSSLKDQGSYVTVWNKWVFRGKKLEQAKKNYGKTFSYSMELRAFKKDVKEVQLLSIYLYGNDCAVLDSHTQSFSPYEYEPIVPDSIGELLWERVMALTNN